MRAYLQKMMDFIYTIYPISAIVVVSTTLLIFIILLATNTILCFMLILLSVTGCISTKPIFELIDYLISTIFENHIKKIKDNLRESFVVKGNFDIKKQAIYSFHPHGVLCVTATLHASNNITNITNWPYKNMKLTAHKFVAELPLVKDIISSSLVSSRYNLMKNVLNEGNSLGISLGGTVESAYLDKNKIVAVVKSRKGIFKMAIESGVPIVPVLVYGENDNFEQMYSFGLFELFAKCIGINRLPCPSFQSIIKWCSIYYKPLDEKVLTYIGDPIEVGEARVATEKEIDDLREKYILGLHDLYNKTKPANYKEGLEIM
jgi:2-acylglycerol O-acyltransferase 2